MRIDRLDLWRFGKFTEFNIDFGEYQPDKPDLHIIYGPNEAGKSTLMAAYLDFLFGIPLKTSYNFKHANKLMKVGAVMSIGDEKIEYRRLKKNKNSLVDANDQPISDNNIQQQLAGLGKDSYATMFSLNDETLEKGGDAILESKGDLGKLLYSATTGVAQLSESLMLLREESDSFYKKSKRNYELKVLKNRLKDIETERKLVDTEANKYVKLVKERDEANKRYQDLGSESDGLRLKIHKLQRKIDAYPRLNSVNLLQRKLVPLVEIPDVPPGWFDEVRNLQVTNTEINIRKQDYEKALAGLDDLLGEINRDDDALNASKQWQEIESYRANYLVACNNLPDIEQQLHVCEHEIAGCLHKLDRANIENPSSLLLSATTQSKIRDLLQQHQPLLSEENVAIKEVDIAKKQHDEIQEKYLMEGGVVEQYSSADESGDISANSRRVAIDALELEIASYSNNELHTNMRVLEQQHAVSKNDLMQKINELGPWVGTGLELQKLNIPHVSELAAIQRARDDIDKKISETKIKLLSVTETLDDARAQQQAYAKTGLVDDSESSRLRAKRDKAWVKHKKTLDKKTAEAFERAMQADDISQGARLQHTESVAQMNQTAREISIAEQSIENVSVQLKQYQNDKAQVIKQLQNQIKTISPMLDIEMTVESLLDWLSTRAEAVQIAVKISSIESEIKDIDAQAAAICSNLKHSLEVAGTTVESDKLENTNGRLLNLLNKAKVAVKREGILSGLRSQLASSQHQLNNRKSIVDKAQNSIATWEESWRKVGKNCWFGTQDEVLGPVAVEEILLQLEYLENHLGNQTELNEKLVHNKEIVKTYSSSLADLAEIVSIASKNIPAEQLYLTLLKRMEQAIEDDKKQASLQKQKDEIVDRNKANDEKHLLNMDSINRMSSHFSVDTIDQVELKLQAAKNKEALQQQLSDEQQQLIEMLDVKTLSDATKLLDNFNKDATQLELNELERNESDIQLQLQEAHTAREQASNAVESVGGDEAVALLREQRANLILQIEDKATRYLQQHLALNAADAALKAYRDNHRSSMMKKASEVFNTMSQGRYARLDTYQEGGSEKLIAIDKDGQSRNSGQLSKGTRFQLYLALRVSGYHEYASSRPPVPFIADDILETSDDERAARIFEVLGDMARVGQVIYLTHHKHLCDLAKKVVPAIRVHQIE